MLKSKFSTEEELNEILATIEKDRLVSITPVEIKKTFQGSLGSEYGSPGLVYKPQEETISYKFLVVWDEGGSNE